MLFVFLLSLFCIGLVFLFYRKKIEKQVEPDYSHIIFKDYSSSPIHKVPSYKADKVDVEEAAKEEKKENSKQQQEEPLLPTLNFED